MAKKNKIFIIQEEFKKRERKRKIWKFIFSLLALIGIAPLLASVSVGWLLPSGCLSPNLPLIFSGLAVSFLSLLATKYLWL